MLVKNAKLKIKYDYIADYICFFASMLQKLPVVQS